MKKVFILLPIAMLILTITALAGTCTITNYRNVPYNSGQNITVTCESATNYTTASLRTNNGLQAIGNENLTSVSGADEQTVFNIKYIPKALSGMTTRCGKVIDASCNNDTLTNVDTCSTAGFCQWEYDTGDIVDVTVDTLGAGGVSFKSFLPLIILFAVLGSLAGLVFVIRKKAT